GLASRLGGRRGRPGCGVVADAEGPELFRIEIGAGNESLVSDEGHEAPVGHVHGITGEARGSGSVPRRRDRYAGGERRPAGGRWGRSGRSARGGEVHSSPAPSLARRRRASSIWPDPIGWSGFNLSS